MAAALVCAAAAPAAQPQAPRPELAGMSAVVDRHWLAYAASRRAHAGASACQSVPAAEPPQ